MRINIEDRALRDPNITRRLPRYTGLGKFDAFGRLLHVWGLAYDQRSAFALIEDVDDRAEHEGFALAMVQAELAERTSEDTIRIRGVEDRIGYLVDAAESGRKGGATRAAQVKAGGRGAGGRFTKGSTTRPLVSDQGCGPSDPSGSTTPPSPSPSPDLDLSLSDRASAREGEQSNRATTSAPPATAPDSRQTPQDARSATESAPAATGAGNLPMVKLASLAVCLLNAARLDIDPTARPSTGPDQRLEMDLAHHLLTIPEADREAAVRHGVAAIAAAVRAGDQPLEALRPGELAGPRSWARWQAASTTDRKPRGRDGPPRPGRPLTGFAATAEILRDAEHHKDPFAP